MRIRLLVAPLCLILTLVASASLNADAPTTAPTSPKGHSPTTQFASAAAVFDAIPDDKRPDAPKKNATDLQSDLTRKQVDGVNKWLAANAVGNPVHVAGKVDNVRAADDGKFEVTIEPEDPGKISVTCSFPPSASDKLLALNRGDAVRIDGTITSAHYDIDFNLFSGQQRFTQSIDVGNCKLQGK